MPEIEREKLLAKLDTIPEQDREGYVQQLKARGYTWKTSAPESEDRFYKKYQVPPQSKLGMALQAGKETMAEDVPYLGRAVEALRSDIPQYIAEKAGAAGAAAERAGYPTAGKAISGAGIAAGGSIGIPAELLPKKGWEVAALGTGPVLEGAGMAAKGVGLTVPNVVSKFTRIEAPVVERYIDAISTRAGKILNKEIATPEFAENAVAKISETVKSGRRALGQQLERIEDAVASKYKDRFIPVSDIGEEVEKTLSKKGYGVSGVSPGDVTRRLNPKVQEIVEDFKNLSKGTPASTSPIVGPTGQAIVTPGTPAVSRKMNLKDALTLKRKIYDAVSYEGSQLLGLDGTEEAILKDAARKLNERIRPVDARLSAATDAFSRAAEAFDDLSRNVFSGKVETAVNRVNRLLNAGSAERKAVQKADRISKSSAASLNTLLDSLTARKFEPLVNPTVERAAIQTGGGLLGAVGIGAHAPYAVPVGAAVMAGTSPRVNALMLRAMYQPIAETELKGLPAASVQAIRALMEKRKKDPAYGTP